MDESIPPLLLILNDTSAYHSGSAEVMSYLVRDAINGGWRIRLYATGRFPGDIHLAEADAVLVNGEGTMHDNAATARRLMECLERAQVLGKLTALVNSVWCRMPRSEIAVLEKLDLLAVREVRSAAALRHLARPPEVWPDVAFFTQPLPKFNPEQSRHRLVVGDFFQRATPYTPAAEHERVSIMQYSWGALHRALAGARVLVTGRHHELIAAARCRVPCVLLEGNTPKIQGLLETAGAVLPVLDGLANDALIEHAIDVVTQDALRPEWERFFDFLQNHPSPRWGAFLKKRWEKRG